MDWLIRIPRRLAALLTLEACFIVALCFPEEFLALAKKASTRLPLFNVDGGGYLLASILVLVGCIILPLFIMVGLVASRARTVEKRRQAAML